MTATVTLHPAFIERIARRMVEVMAVPPGDNYEQERAHSRLLEEFGIACEGGIVLTDEQWNFVFRRVESMRYLNEQTDSRGR